ncbi:MAG: guanylate kinase [Verrucomicrobia bacterium]|nr:guanylate kinase [Verrucomicrobiota bacterium]
MRPLLIVVSAPSGAGKTSICDRLLKEFDWIQYSVSCTTRPPRGREVNGVNYEFVTPDRFNEYKARGDFLEHAEVHGYQYGTRRTPVIQALESGKSVLMDIDVQGAAQIREAAKSGASIIRNAYVDIFIEPPSLDVLQERLSARGEDAPEIIAKRLQNAIEELRHSASYTHHVVNNNFDDAFADFRQIVLMQAQANTGS